MASPVRIESADREFFELIAQAAFSNPFSEERAELDQRIVGRRISPFFEDRP
ncbi:MAG: hypothetical protein HY674_02915, partial [Chloroflexi bacterium]|nr:hypothetical protein [Chloroflexota bacterium]